MPGQTVAEQQAFVFLVELQYLQNAAAGVFELLAGGAFANRRRGNLAQGHQDMFEPLDELAFAPQQPGFGRALVLAEETVLLQRKLVEFLTECLMLLQMGGDHVEGGFCGRASRAASAEG